METSKNSGQQAPFTNAEEYQQYVESLCIEGELFASAARSIIIARYSEWSPDGQRYSTDEEVAAARERLVARGEWPAEPADGGPVIGRALANRRRSALWSEGIVTRSYWI